MVDPKHNRKYIFLAVVGFIFIVLAINQFVPKKCYWKRNCKECIVATETCSSPIMFIIDDYRGLVKEEM